MWVEWDKPGKSRVGRRKGLASKTLDRTLAGARKFNWPTAYVNALLPLLKRQLEAEIADAETLISDGPAIRKQLKKALSDGEAALRSEEHTSELQSLMRISYAVFCLKKKTHDNQTNITSHNPHKNT